MPKLITLPNGTRFGKLTVQCLSQQRGKLNQVYWTCLCDCGRIAEVRSGHLRADKTLSCGDCPRESKSITHGMSHSPEFNVWAKMKARCLNPSDAAFDRYGGRGITIFKKWINNFQAFYDCVGARPTPQHTLERINNNKGYTPSNVCWATRTEQSRNRRSNRNMTLNGRTQIAIRWSEELSIPATNIYTRKRLGWSDEKTLTTPIRHFAGY